jgi:hypothetical protein
VSQCSVGDSLQPSKPLGIAGSGHVAKDTSACSQSSRPVSSRTKPPPPISSSAPER